MDSEWQGSPGYKGPGSQLEQARLARNLSIENVAFELRLSPQLIQDLENDSPDPALNKTFVRGYLRNYARFVGLSTNQIIQDFEKWVEPTIYPKALIELSAPPSEATRVTWADFYEEHQKKMRLLIGTAFVGLFLTIGGISGVFRPNPQPALPAVPEPVAQSALPAKSIEISRGILELHFNEECWVTIFDGNHARLVTGIQTPDNPLRFEGKPPFQVMLGNADAATLRYNGAPVAVEKTKPGNGIVNLTLG